MKATIKHCITHLEIHCPKNVRIQSRFWSVFSSIRTEYGDLHRTYPYSARLRKIKTRNNSVFRHFSRSDSNLVPWVSWFYLVLKDRIKKADENNKGIRILEIFSSEFSVFLASYEVYFFKLINFSSTQK